MPEARTSARLRKRPRISYAPPDDLEEPSTNDGTAADDATGHHAESESESSEDEDEEFTLKGRKVSRNLSPHLTCFNSQLEQRKKKKKSKKKKRGRVTKPEEPKPFRFMDLPAELRNAIYDFALSRPYPLRLSHATRQGRHTVLSEIPYTWPVQKVGNGKTNLVPNLLLLNKAVRAESGPILYQNEFTFKDYKAIWHFMRPLSQTTKSWIERIGLEDLRGKPSARAFAFPAFDSLATLPNLRSFQLMDFHTLPSFRYYSESRLVRSLVKEGYSWLEAVGEAKNNKYAAVELLTVRADAQKAGPSRGDRSGMRYSTKVLATREDIEEGNHQLRERVKAEMK